MITRERKLVWMSLILSAWRSAGPLAGILLRGACGLGGGRRDPEARPGAGEPIEESDPSLGGFLGACVGRIPNRAADVTPGLFLARLEECKAPLDPASNQDFRKNICIVVSEVIEREPTEVLRHFFKLRSRRLGPGAQSRTDDPVSAAAAVLLTRWAGRLQLAAEDPTREKLIQLFPKGSNLRLETVYAETEAFVDAPYDQVAGCWVALYDEALAGVPGVPPPPPNPFGKVNPGKWFGNASFGAGYERGIDPLGPEDRADLREAVTQVLQRRFPVHFAAYIKTEEGKQAWIGFQKFSLATMRIAVLRMEEENRREEYQELFAGLHRRLDAFMDRSTLLAERTARLVGVMERPRELIYSALQLELDQLPTGLRQMISQVTDDPDPTPAPEPVPTPEPEGEPEPAPAEATTADRQGQFVAPAGVVRQIPPRAPKFVGRRRLIHALADRLNHRRSTDLWGPAGIGKTCLAAEAIVAVVGETAESLAASLYPDGVVFIDLHRIGADPEAFWNELALALAPSMSTDRKSRDRALDACRGKKALIVVDGAEVAGREFSEHLRVLSPENVRLIMTTDKSQTMAIQRVDFQTDLPRPEAVELMHCFDRGLSPADLVDGIYTRLGGHPLALTWAGSQLAFSKEPPENLIKELDQTKVQPVIDPSSRQHLFQWLFIRSTRLMSTDANTVLGAAARMAFDAFPTSMAETVLGGDNADVRARSALAELGRFNLVRAVPSDNTWHICHSMAYGFLRQAAAGAPQPMAPMGVWVWLEINSGQELVRRTGDFTVLRRALNHACALLAHDRGGRELRRLAGHMLYDLQDSLFALGNLDLPRTVSQAICAWYDDWPDAARMQHAWLREKSVALNRLGDVLLAQTNVDEARRMFVSSLKLTQGLLAVDPTNTQWMRDLVMTRARLGNLCTVYGDDAKAREYFTEALEVAERLTRIEPSNAFWQSDLSWLRERMDRLA